ncbi:DMT family transporter [Paracoccus sp. MBLB3053]|uniref:DMT family transporter n=1 Tax=Paracoccus aurantius TaxID=3073814 RepID=A0ABU2HXC0_9RHOB|nr:DMT family transporter [Paracoccus sp. MBLB3053]MDS9469709.1 DMT family transporter [Paracoccus sp. MBLB3053]
MTVGAKARADRTELAVAVMVLTDLTLSVADAMIKATLAEMPLSQFVFLRSCITLPLLILILKLWFPQVSLRPARPGWALLRSGLLLASLLLYYASLNRLDLSMAAAIYYTIPLFITLFSAVLIREAVGPRGWTGVVLGFGGVLLMLRPEARDLNLSALMPLASATLYALAMVLTRSRARTENPFVLALVFNLLAIALSGMASPSGAGNAPDQSTGTWLQLDPEDWVLLVLLSGMMLIGSVGTAIAYQSGPPAIVSTWDFSYLAFAVLWGVVLFSEQLDLASILGISLIALAGIAVIRR